MSPRSFKSPAPEAVVDAERRIRVGLGIAIRDARLAKRWSVAELARRAVLSTDVVYLIEAGRTASIEAVVRLVNALGLRLELELTDPRRKTDARPSLSRDLVHSAMGEFEATHLRRHMIAAKNGAAHLGGSNMLRSYQTGVSEVHIHLTG